jgi:hypothetical protein
MKRKFEEIEEIEEKEKEQKEEKEEKEKEQKGFDYIILEEYLKINSKKSCPRYKDEVGPIYFPTLQLKEIPTKIITTFSLKYINAYYKQDISQLNIYHRNDINKEVIDFNKRIEKYFKNKRNKNKEPEIEMKSKKEKEEKEKKEKEEKEENEKEEKKKKEKEEKEEKEKKEKEEKEKKEKEEKEKKEKEEKEENEKEEKKKKEKEEKEEKEKKEKEEKEENEKEEKKKKEKEEKEKREREEKEKKEKEILEKEIILKNNEIKKLEEEMKIIKKAEIIYQIQIHKLKNIDFQKNEMNNEIKIKEDKLTFLSKGTFGEVYVVNKYFARKFFKTFDDASREISMLLVLKGLKNILKIEKYELTNEKHFFDSQLYNQNLQVYIETFDINERDKILIIEEIFLAIKNIHQKKILHLDLKPQNIFINSVSNLVVGDYSLSCKKNFLEKKTFFTSFFRDIDCFEHNFEKINENSDYFAFGIIVYFVFTKKVSFLNFKIRL